MRKRFTLLLSMVLCQMASAQMASIQAPMPAQTSTFSSNARGYWFVAPSCFTLTGVEVPTTASAGPQSIAIVRFYATPPTFSATTNAFTTLFLTQSNPTAGIIPVNIQVEQGDIIGVMGVRSDINSYSNTGNTTTIEGISVPLTRLGMQLPLSSNAPQNLWQEPTSLNITRTFMYYDSLLYFNLTSTPVTSTSFAFDNDADSSFVSVWDYGDGSPLDTAWNPTHNYASDGTYNVCSYITTSCGTDTVCTQVSVCVSPTADYTLNSQWGLTASFNNTSTGSPSTWLWDFGDGSTDTTANPSHTWATAGNYNVCLIATNACGIDTMCYTVSACNLPAPAFSYVDNPGGATDFTDMSAYPGTWLWDFGDGNTDTTANPSHTYASNGTYVVCLTATNSCGAETWCDTLTVCPLVAAAGFSSTSAGGGVVNFTDASVNATSLLWDFGDGGTSTLPNPSHTYATNGTFTVCLYSSNACTTDSLCDTVTVCPLLPVSSFTQSSTQFTVTFTNTSSNGSSYHWDFGDGNTSTSASPVHSYVNNGLYQVCLTTWNLCGDSSTACDSLLIDVVGTQSPQAGASISLSPNPFQDQAELRVNLPGSTSYTLTITDLQGAVVAVQQGQTNVPLTVNSQNLSSGVYLYRIHTRTSLLGQGKMVVNH